MFLLTVSSDDLTAPTVLWGNEPDIMAFPVPQAEPTAQPLCFMVLPSVTPQDFRTLYHSL